MGNSGSNKTRIVCISDTHLCHDFALPAGDILVHSGDFSMTGEQTEIETFITWLKSLTQYRLKIIIAGNHDLTLEPEYYEKTWQQWHAEQKQDYQQIGCLIRDPSLATNYGIIYLEQQEFIDPQTGLKFFGSPYQPAFGGWAFNLPADSPAIKQVWSKIPDDVDVLITHGPPANILDGTISGEHAGCAQLLKRIKQIKPRLHVFGHIHEGYGREEHNSTIFVNASTCNVCYNPSQSPIIVDLKVKRRK
jgi:predicted phosphodiesterase